MTREQLADLLENIALLLELGGENPFKVRAYRQGAEAVLSYEGDIVAWAKREDFEEIKGIGTALREKLHEAATTGRLEFYEDLKAQYPSTIFELFELQGLGPKKVKTLFSELQVGSVLDLKAACASGKVAGLPGFGVKTQAGLVRAIAQWETFADRFLLASVTSAAKSIEDALRAHPDVSQVSVAGSFRRAKETLHDLDFVVATKSPQEVIQDFVGLPEVAQILAQGETKGSVRLHDGLQCDLRAVSQAEFPFALQYFTGSKEHNVALRSLALKQGLSLNEYGFTPVEGKSSAALPAIDDEAGIYHALGLEWIDPALRENRGEIEASQTPGELPELIELENLRGTFHNHTHASDGANSLEEMADEAKRLGLQYLGISDHSKSSYIANGLDEERLLEQIAIIRRYNQAHDDLHLFAGSEVDILKDGSLDFSDEILSQLDFTVASVHNVFNLSEEEMTRRICRAMENEHITMLGHLTGRLLLKRSAYPVNHAMIIDCAAETNTLIELNCSPMRLDMDWRWWKLARDKGVLCSINPDAHSIERLHHLALGVRLARKGWLLREDVLNTRSLKDVQTFLSSPKSKRR